MGVQARYCEKQCVEYSPRFGGVCACGQTNTHIYMTDKWMGNVRVRRHMCPVCGNKFQSVDVDRTVTTAKILAEAIN